MSKPNATIRTGDSTLSDDVPRGRIVPQQTSADPVILQKENDTGGAITEGTVCILKSNGKLGLTSTAGYTGIVLVALDEIDAGDDGPVQLLGDVDQVNTTGSVAPGSWLETSSTPGLAQASATRHAGSFAYVTGTASVTNPEAFLAQLVAELGVAGFNLADLADVDLTGAVRGDFLRFDGTNWVDAGGERILLADGRGAPFTFNDMLQMDDGSDFMWSDLP